MRFDFFYIVIGGDIMKWKKLVYSILKKIEQGNEPKKTDYELSAEQWGEIVELICE